MSESLKELGCPYSSGNLAEKCTSKVTTNKDIWFDGKID
tara:strand:- start:88 stop:204 length:117 start_codon:yes stop_codon:yes gene_type:complete